jgi:transcriptional regulator with XRE-family HTH domain
MKTDKTPISPAIGRRLRARREELGYTQSQLSERMNTDSAWISRCESGKNLTIQTLERFAKELRIKLSELTSL